MTTPEKNSHLPTLISSATQFVNIKLTIENFLLWKAQIVPFLKGHQLFGYVDGSIPSPTTFIDGNPNPEHKKWVLQDQLLISILNSSLSDSVLSQVLDCTTSHEVWTTLHNLFSAKSNAHVFHTQYQLATLRKGSESITDYYNKAKSLFSSLGAAGHPITDQEFSVYLLAGLGTEYESLVTALTTRPDPLSPHQIYSFLLNHESRLAHQTQSLLSGPHFSANTTTSKFSPGSSSSHRGRNSSFRGGRRGRGGCNGGRNAAASTSNYFQNRPDTRLYCQVCSKAGHSALTCYYRFDHAYQAPAPSSLAANFTALPPHVSTSNWFPDSAATHHFTADLAYLNLDSTPYQGSDQVSIGDGSTLPIQHSGSAHLHSPSGKFILHNLLHVPSISRNLLSVRQFCLDNHVYFEFHSHFFLVKDSATQAVRLKGLVEDGLYTLPSTITASQSPSTSTPKAFLVSTSPTQWHERLGHPSTRVTNLTIQRFSLPTTSTREIAFCPSCITAKAHALPHPISPTVSSEPFKLLFADMIIPNICGFFQCNLSQMFPLLFLLFSNM
ncbi:hypothetical protein F2P56_003155 [Juglans regia]|uniref:GAG-pre-integrase domain-containing protein n=1 Tax=Juglans regia TaxID=51240 RepID=A0A833Y2L6_JUGRE|nr:hypothetical protein F2P56_003155 [Juglans regia]